MYCNGYDNDAYYLYSTRDTFFKFFIFSNHTKKTNGVLFKILVQCMNQLIKIGS